MDKTTMDKTSVQRSKQYLLVASVIAASFAGGYVAQSHDTISSAQATNAPVAMSPRVAPSTNTVSLPNFASIVSAQGPAVVNISVKGTVKSNSPLAQIDPNDPFFEFFRRFQPNVPEEHPVGGMGSGFIVKSDGVILTNAHVVANADEVTVKLTDKREFQAKVIGVDKPTDVAVLKIEAKDLPTVKVGSTQGTQVGDWVVAIGAPFGFENSVTAGIVSAKSRALPDEGYVPFLQTDVAINPGNSGGPLFNMNGEVIGINSQIYSRSGGYQGLSFAIPIDVAMTIEQQLLDHGKVSRGRLGVGIQALDASLANSFGLDKASGALVSQVEKGSPADKAGIEPGDVILKFNGQPIERSQDLPPLVAAVPPGKTASVEVWHKQRMKRYDVKVDELKTAEVATDISQDSKAKLGVAVRPLTDEELAQAEVRHGVLVENVTRGPAAKAGIRPGDVILAVNGESVDNVNDLKSLIEKSPKHVAILVMRGDNKLYVPVELG